MKFWYLSRISDYDQTSAHLVRAKDEHSARMVAFQGDHADCSGRPCYCKEWLETAKCDEVPLEGPEEIVMSDFLEG